MRFGVFAATVAFALAIASGAGAYALSNSAPTPAPIFNIEAFESAPVADAVMVGVTPAVQDIPREQTLTVVDEYSTTTAPPRVEPIPAPTPAPTPKPIAPTAVQERPAAVAAPAVVPEPRVEASRETLYGAIAAAFPEQPDKAYRVVMCESEGHAATNTGNGYYGLWQFDLPTWRSVGGTGLPSDASIQEQVMRARMLYDKRGWGPWGCA